MFPVKISGGYWKLHFCFQIRFLWGKSVFSIKCMYGFRGDPVLTGFTATSVVFIFTFELRGDKNPKLA